MRPRPLSGLVVKLKEPQRGHFGAAGASLSSCSNCSICTEVRSWGACRCVHQVLLTYPQLREFIKGRTGRLFLFPSILPPPPLFLHSTPLLLPRAGVKNRGKSCPLFAAGGGYLSKTRAKNPLREWSGAPVGEDGAPRT
jgi:hypothetical protein